MGAEQVIEESNHPRPVEEIDPPSATVLLRFPAHQRAQVRHISRVHHETQLTSFPLQLARSAAQVLAELRGFCPELLLVRGKPVGQIDHR